MTDVVKHRNLSQLQAIVAVRFGLEAPAPEPLARALRDALARARPGAAELDDDGETFLAHLVDRLPDDAPPLESIERVRAADLFSAWECAQGRPAALRAFRATHGPALRLAAGRVPGSDPADVEQTIYTRLLTGDRPRIADYAGQGELRHWLRVTVTRLVIDLARRRSETIGPDADRNALALRDPADDPELAHLKRLYSQEFRSAFEAAVAELSAVERATLRRHYVDGHGIDQIAAADQIHRATAARQIQRARTALVAATRRCLAARLRLSDPELESVMRAVDSQVHVSVRRVLIAAAP